MRRGSTLSKVKSSQQARFEYLIHFKSSDEELGDVVFAHQLEEDGQENGKVAIVVTIDQELLKRIEDSVHPHLPTEGTSTGVDGGEEGLHFIRSYTSG